MESLALATRELSEQAAAAVNTVTAKITKRRICILPCETAAFGVIQPSRHCVAPKHIGKGLPRLHRIW